MHLPIRNKSRLLKTTLRTLIKANRVTWIVPKATNNF